MEGRGQTGTKQGGSCHKTMHVSHKKKSNQMDSDNQIDLHEL